MAFRTRFAPSPTGYLHVGGLRTALYSYLLAQKNNGEFLLRLEDTDRERFVADGALNILNSLYWAGVVPDEGLVLQNGEVKQKGDKGPYIQSERLEIYQKYINQLLESGHAYYCFCAQERLEEVRQICILNKKQPMYDGHCKTISLEEAKKKIANGEKYTVRLNMPKDGETVFNDLIRGEVRIKNEIIDDQVLIKSDGYPTYHFAVVIDDHLMEITHVVRGEEWISSTPKHIELYKAFGWKAPEFAHLPLLLNSDKSKLSKRQGDVAVEDYRKKGYLPQALINFVAFLGWNPGGDRELFSADDLIKEFSLDKVNKAGAVFNLEKLDWFNREYLKTLSDEELVKNVLPWVEKKDWFKKDSNSAWLAKVFSLEKERITTLTEMPEAIKFVFVMPDYKKEELIWKKSDQEKTVKILRALIEFLGSFNNEEWIKNIMEDRILAWIKENSLDNGSVLWPMRVALSGQRNSPGPLEIAEVLGKNEVINRLNQALSKLSA